MNITSPFEMDFVLVPKGRFLMGSNKKDQAAFEDERPQSSIEIHYDYYIGRCPVTNKQFAAFIEFSSHSHPWIADWKNKLDHPVVNVDWNAATAFCKWMNQSVGFDFSQGWKYRLPTEAEWEKAARGVDGREWPWGNYWEADRCNALDGAPGTTTPVGKYSPEGDSPYAAVDMAGNVWEWTNSLGKPYPYDPNDGREDDTNPGSRVVRGGSWGFDHRYARCAYRVQVIPEFYLILLGFRVVLAPIFPTS